MNDVNNVDLSELKLYCKVNPNISFNKKNSSFVSYLKGLREYDKTSTSRPSNIVKLIAISLLFLRLEFFHSYFLGKRSLKS